MVRSAIVRIGAAVGLVAVALVGVAGPAAAAGPTPPPGWISPTGWVAFTLADPSPTPIGRGGTYEPVTLQRTISPGLDVLTAFSNWDPTDHDGNPLTDDHGWPTSWAPGPPSNLVLERVAWCDYTAPTCEYRVEDGDSGQPLFFFAGVVPETVPGVPDFDLNNYDQGSLILAPGPQLHAGIDPNLSPVPGSGGTAGKVTLTAAGFTHDDLAGTTLSYEWVLKNLDTGKFFAATGETSELTLDQDGTYCIQLKVTASDGATAETPACGAVGVATFLATGFAPAAPTPTPTPGAGGGSSGGGGGIVFARPIKRAPAAAAVVSAPTVVWLWRPDWFQATADENVKQPKTTDRPELEGRRDIVVNATTASGASAVPWLAGLGLFGLLGGAWIVRRRHMLHLPPEL